MDSIMQTRKKVNAGKAIKSRQFLQHDHAQKKQNNQVISQAFDSQIENIPQNSDRN
jgi:hypothetical protein